MIRIMRLTEKARASLALLAVATFFCCVALLAHLSVSRLPPQENVAAVSAARVFSLTNEERSDRGVATLARNERLDQAAQMKAQDMAAKGYYAHVSPEGLTPMHWVDRAGYEYLVIGENLVVNRKDAGEVVDAFMGSPGHRANILRNDFTEIGVGVADGTYKGKDATFAVQIFAAPYPRAVPVPVIAPVEPIVKPVPLAPRPAPAPIAPPPVPAENVPRTVAVQPTIPARVETPTQTTATSTLPERIENLFEPILSVAQSTSTFPEARPSGPLFESPAFFVGQASPIELASVSQLETETPPVPVGSVWTARMQLFAADIYTRLKGFFVREAAL